MTKRLCVFDKEIKLRVLDKDNDVRLSPKGRAFSE
jgi:hypothetical protein